MDFYKVLEDIMHEKDLGVPDVARACGLSDSTVRSILKRKQQNVALEVAFKIANGLNVSLERLNGEEKNEAKLNYHRNYSKEELELLEKFSSLSSANRSKLSELLDLYLNAQNKS